MSSSDGLPSGARVSPDGFALECAHCRQRFPEDITVAVLAAHFEVEHQTTDVKVELTVVCRCDRAMAFVRSEETKDLFTCESCHRSRVVKREGA